MFDLEFLPLRLARRYVLQALNERHAVHPSGEVLQLPRFCPWKVRRRPRGCALRALRGGKPSRASLHLSFA